MTTNVRPVIIGRVSEYMKGNALTNSAVNAQTRMLEQQIKLSSGYRINRPSDDPVGTVGSMRLTEAISTYEQLMINQDYANSMMSTADTVLNEAYTGLIEAQTVASENATTLVSAEDRKAAATVIDSIITQMMNVANTTFRGVYIFGGQQSVRAPVSMQSSSVVFDGEVNTTDLPVDQTGRPLAFNVTADDAFGVRSGYVAGRVDVQPTMTSDTRLSTLQGARGVGIALGSIVIEGSVNGRTVVDLSGSETVEDVLNKITQSTPADITAAINPLDNRSLIINSANAGEILTISDQINGTTAADLGILAPTNATNTIFGNGVSPIITSTSPIATITNGGAIDLSDLKISDGSQTVTLDLSDPSIKTVEDMLNAINNSDVAVRAEINRTGTGFDIYNLAAGTSMYVSGQTANDLGVSSFHGGVELADLRDGKGITTVGGNDFRVTARDGSTFDVDVSGIHTVQDVIDAINAAAVAGVTADINPTTGGIRLTDTTGGGGNLSVTSLQQSSAAAQLGIETSVAGNVLQGSDIHPIRDHGAFGALVDLRDALLGDDTVGITQAGERVETFIDELASVRGELGYRVRNLESRTVYSEDAILSTQSLLSDLRDLDYTEAITEFQRLQTIMQASLMTSGQIMNTSLLNYLS